MTDRTYEAAGTALLWKVVQLGGTQLIFLLRLLVLARLLAPDDFGLLTVAATAIGFLLSISELGMVPAMVQRKEVSESQYDVAWTVSVARAAMVAGAILLSAPVLAAVFSEPRAIPILRVLAIRPLLDAMASIKVVDLERNLRFRPLAVLGLAGALASAVASIASAPFLGVWALVAGDLTRSTLYLLASYLVAPHRPRLSVDRTALVPLVRFGRWVFLTGLIVLVGSYVLRVVISRQLGAAELGLYYLGTQIGFLPYQVASGVIGAVAFPLFARLQADVRQAAQAFRAMLLSTCAALAPGCALIVAVTPSLVQNVLGPRWAGTVSVIRVLVLVSLVDAFGALAAPVLKGLGQPNKVTLVETAQSLVIIALAWGLARRYGLVGAVFAWVPATLVAQALDAAFVRRALVRPFARLGAAMSAIVFSATAGASVALAIDGLVAGLVGLILGVGSSLIVAWGLILVLDRRFSFGITEGLVRAFPQSARWIGYIT